MSNIVRVIELPCQHDIELARMSLYLIKEKGKAWYLFYDKSDIKHAHPYIFCHGTLDGRLAYMNEHVDPGTFLNNMFPEERISWTKDITFISCYGIFFKAGYWKGIPVRHIYPECATIMVVALKGNYVLVYDGPANCKRTLYDRYLDYCLKHFVKPVACAVMRLRKWLGKPERPIKQYN